MIGLKKINQKYKMSLTDTPKPLDILNSVFIVMFLRSVIIRIRLDFSISLRRASSLYDNDFSFLRDSILKINLFRYSFNSKSTLQTWWIVKSNKVSYNTPVFRVFLRNQNLIMHHCCMLLLAFSLSTGFAQNWQEAAPNQGIDNAAITNLLYTDTIIDKLIVGGEFQDDARTLGYKVFLYDSGKVISIDSSAYWEPFISTVDAAFRYRGDLYFGGTFLYMGDTNLKTHNIARYKNGKFEVVNSKVNSPPANGVYALEEYNNQLIIGGQFNKLADVTSNGIITYDSNGFGSIDGGVKIYDTNIWVRCLKNYKGKLYVGGVFINEPTKLGRDNGLQVWDGTKWGIVDGWRCNRSTAEVLKMVEYKGDLIISGNFRVGEDGAIANNIVRFDGTHFYEMGAGSDWAVRDMKVHNGELYVAGWFTLMDGIPAYHFAKWNGTHWCNLSNVDTFNKPVMAIEFYKDTLFALGWFDEVNGQPLQHFAKWVGNPSMVDSCAPPARQDIVNFNLGLQLTPTSTHNVRVYPNPTQNKITIETINKFAEIKFHVLNMQGIELESGILNRTSELDVSSLPKGIYMLKLDIDNETNTMRIIKQ